MQTQISMPQEITNYLAKIKPNYSGYQELHVHTVGSYRDAANTVNDVFDAAEELGRNAVAITDHGNWTRLFSALKEQTSREKKYLKKALSTAGASEEDISAAIKAMGDFDTVRNPNEKMYPFIRKYESAYIDTAKNTVKFIPGVEMYEAEPVEGDTNRYHIILYPTDWKGAQVLFTLCNLAQLNKHNGMPRCTMETLRFFLSEGSRGHGHVIGTSACMSGHLATILLQPFYIRENIKELEKQEGETTFISDEFLCEAQGKINSLEVKLKDKKEELRETKKLANKKFTAALSRAEKALEKARLKSSSCGQTSFDGCSVQDKSVTEAQEKLDTVKKDMARSQECAEIVPVLQQEVSDINEELKKSKASFKELEKRNAPAHKIRAKIEAKEQELKDLGDVYEKAKSVAMEYNKIFGKGNFFIELQNHGLLEELLIRESLIRIARECDIPLTVANDVHYKNLEMKRKRDIIAALRFPDTTVSDVANRLGADQLWFKPNEAMMEEFKDVPDAIENTNRIAERCNVFYKKEMHLPEFEDTKNHLSPDKYLRKMSYDNIHTRYPDIDQWDDKRKDAFYQRLNYELGIIENMGYSSYISIVEDFISYAKRNYSSESVGAGRGSGAGSLVCFLTGITNIDPLRYNLIFERFLNPERVSMPDIDTDFAPSIRKDIIDYVSDKYAYKEDYWVPELSDTVCSIFTEGKLAARSAVRQVGKVTGVSLPVCDKVAKLVPSVPKMTLKKAMDEVPQLKEMYDSDNEIKKLIDDALLVEGTPVQTGVHAAGVIIADKPISEYAPLFMDDKKGQWAIQYDMVSCESDIGLLKMDFLGLRNLDIIMRAKYFIKKTQGKVLNFAEINKADDLSVVDDVYARGDTDGVFQFESGGMKKTLQSFAPTTIDDVILMNAAYRPGPMQYIPEVTDVKLGRKPAHYIIPEMKNILGATYGSPIYQEQIQQIFHEIAGLSLGQADVIRRAMSKKHLDELESAKDDFVKGFLAKGAAPEEIENFWGQLLEFAKYAFNKSHAAAYSVVSYYTAWLKHYYPVEYMASLMSYSTKSNIGLYIKDAKEYGITVLAPHVNCSIVYTAPTKKREIRFGLEGIKGVAAAAEKIIAERKMRGQFKSYRDFIIRCAINGIGKEPIEGLILAGAMVGLVENRQETKLNLPTHLSDCRRAIKAILKNHPEIEELQENEQNQRIYEAISNDETFDTANTVPSIEFDYNEMLMQEKEYAGFYTSGHPLDKHKNLLKSYATEQIADVNTDMKSVTFAGHIINYKILYRKKDNQPMCKFEMEDLTDSIPTVCFPYQYKRLASQLEEGAVVALTGDVEVELDEEENVIQKQFIVSSGRRIV